MQITESVQGANGKLTMSGRFDFHSHRDFRTAYESLIGNAQVREIDVNFAGVDYLDSSALGMLLLLREKAESAGKKVYLSGVKGVVRQVLEIANFGKLFTFRD